MGCGSSRGNSVKRAEEDINAALAINLSSILGVTPASADVTTYLRKLRDEGCDTAEDFNDLSLEELADAPFNFKRLHLKKVLRSRAKQKDRQKQSFPLVDRGRPHPIDPELRKVRGQCSLCNLDVFDSQPRLRNHKTGLYQHEDCHAANGHAEFEPAAREIGADVFPQIAPTRPTSTVVHGPAITESQAVLSAAAHIAGILGKASDDVKQYVLVLREERYSNAPNDFDGIAVKEFRSRRPSTETPLSLKLAATDGAEKTEPPCSFPDRRGNVTAAFLSEVFGRSVASFEIKALGLGYVGDAFKITLSYADTAPFSEATPKTAVLKFGKENELARVQAAPLFQLECSWYRAVGGGGPLADCAFTSAKAYGVYTNDADITKFCLCLEDCYSSPDGVPLNIETHPNFLVGVPAETMRGILCDLARAHGQYFNSPLLTALPIFEPAKLPPGVELFSKSDYAGPFVGLSFAAYFPFAGAAAADVTGADAADCFTMYKALLHRDQDKFQLDYVCADGKTHRIPDGPIPYPHPTMEGKKGLIITKQVCAEFATRPMTLLHGDGHPGNVFRDNVTHAFKWIDFQGVHRGPPGLELSQGLALGLQGASKALLVKVSKDYYDALVAAGPPGLAQEYTYEMLWDDMLGGMLLWYSAYMYIQCQTMPALWDEEDGGEERLAGLRHVFPRYIVLMKEIGLMEYAEKLYSKAVACKKADSDFASFSC